MIGAPIAARLVVLDRVAYRLRQRSRISHERKQVFPGLLGHRQVGRVLEPDVVLGGCLHLGKPIRGELGIDIEVVASGENQ
jgi:hypothetical protein